MGVKGKKKVWVGWASKKWEKELGDYLLSDMDFELSKKQLDDSDKKIRITVEEVTRGR